MGRGLFHSIKHVIRWPLREEIRAYVIPLRSQAVFKLGWPPGVWKQEIISKAQRKIPAGFCLSPSTFLLSSPAPAALAAPALAALLALEALWKRQSVISATRARECGSQPSQSLGGKKPKTNQPPLHTTKGNLAEKVRKLNKWARSRRVLRASDPATKKTSLRGSNSGCSRGRTLAFLPRPVAQNLRRVLKQPHWSLKAWKFFVRKF